MDMIDLYTLSLTEFRNSTSMQDVVMTFFDVSEHKAKNIVREINFYTKDLKDDIFLAIETNYVDKVYRDSYYCYYSTKLGVQERNCIKISFFNTEIHPQIFYESDYISTLKNNYLGFMVIRPTSICPVGRNVISPKALKDNNIRVCSTHIESTTSGIKLDVVGFPHSSQDTETMTCAETTIWALMEYFGNKYPEYRPTLPSHILKTLEQQTYDRQMPSKGLRYQDISYALRAQGFGTVVYSEADFGEQEFKKLFSCYIESGIPIAVAIANKGLGHAVLCIGRKDVSGDDIKRMHQTTIDGKTIYEWNGNIENFVFIDDNMPPYQTANFSMPTNHYMDDQWKDCKITHFVVPLYHKIYMEAHNAINISMDIALKDIMIENNSVVRTFLTSSRSYKNYIFKNQAMEPILKEFIRGRALPKFIWVTEIASVEDCKNSLINGAVVLDATEVHAEDYAPFILAHYKGHTYNFSPKDNHLERVSLSLQSRYTAFEGNLKLL
jgi:hypothetical protein